MYRLFIYPPVEVGVTGIKYDKLIHLLEKKCYTTYRIRQENIMSQSAWQKIRTGTGHIDTRTIEKLCNILDCQPGDIMEYEKETGESAAPVSTNGHTDEGGETDA